MSLPWDRFTPDPAPEPELPYVPPPTAPEAPLPAPPQTEPAPRPHPAPVPPDTIQNAVNEALATAWPALRDQVVNYARESINAIRAGHTVDLTHPTVTAHDMTGRELVVADAKSRSWRTLIQGLIFDVFAAIVAAVAMLSGADPFVIETWIAFGILLLKSVVSAVISYFMRLRVTPTIRTQGEKYAIAPIPRPMVDYERKESA